MVDDPNRKTPRTFQCRDYLWESFETMSGELECSIDYLINEAMRHYLRAQGRTGPTRTTMNGDRSSLPGASPSTTSNFMAQPGAVDSRPARPPATPPGNVPSAARPAGPPQMPARTSSVGPASSTTPYPNGAAAIPSMRQPAIPPLSSQSSRTSPPVQTRGPAPPPIVQPQRAQGQRVLYAVYDGQEVPVMKEEFFIGRTQRMCDLVIRDTNISRQHARVVLHNGSWWIIDNQSTNGVEFRGAKIQQKRVDDGDVFTICGHDVQFVYR